MGLFANIKAVDGVFPVGLIAPTDGETTTSTGWVPVQNFEKFLFAVVTGALPTAGVINAQVQQASDSSGTGAKSITDNEGHEKQLTAIDGPTASGGDQVALINFAAEDLDTNNGFAYVKASITVTGASCYVAGLLLGCGPRFAPPYDQTSNPTINLGTPAINQVVY